jgi:hypothetical protein
MPGTPDDAVGLHAAVALDPDTFAPHPPYLRPALAGEAAVCEITHEDSGGASAWR